MAGLAVPELRAIAWGHVIGPVVVGTTLLALTAAGLLDGPQPTFLWLGLGALILGVVACLDEPAAMVTGACPATRRRRTVERLLAAVPVVVGWCVLAGFVDGVNGLSGSALARTGTGSLLAAIAAADVLRRLGVDEPGPVVGSVSLLGVLGCLLFQPFGGVVVLQAYDDLGSTDPLASGARDVHRGARMVHQRPGGPGADSATSLSARRRPGPAREISHAPGLIPGVSRRIR